MNRAVTSKVESVSRATRILRAFEPHSRVLTVREIAARAGMSRSSCHAICVTLVAEGFLENRPGGGYQLGWALASLGGQVLERTGLVEAASSWLEQLCSHVGGEVHLGQYVPGHIIYLARLRGDKRVRMPNRFGFPVSAHLTGAGWATLSALSDEELADVVRGLPTVPDRMLEQIDRGRRLCFIVHDSARLGVRAVAAPIVINGRVIGAIAVAQLRRLLDAGRLASTAEGVRAAARHIERQLQSFE